MSSIENKIAQKVSVRPESAIAELTGVTSGVAVALYLPRTVSQRETAFEGMAQTVREAIAKERRRLEQKNERLCQARLQAEQQ